MLLNLPLNLLLENKLTKDTKTTKNEKGDTETDYSQPPAIVDREEAPKWLHFNPHMKYGYRIHHYKATDLFKSICTLHNETTNIWTHIIAAALFAILFAICISDLTATNLVYADFSEKISEIDWNQYSDAQNSAGILNLVGQISEGGNDGKELYLQIYSFYAKNAALLDNSKKFLTGVTKLVYNTPNVFKDPKDPSSKDVSAFQSFFDEVSRKKRKILDFEFFQKLPKKSIFSFTDNNKAHHLLHFY